jgi:hypothetical protein
LINAQFVPIESWPGEPTRRRVKAPFTVSYQKMLNDLERELRHLGARSIVVQAFLRGDDIRNDGWPRSSARFNGPGIVLSFMDRAGAEISFPCDTYVNWDSNLRAVSLTLSALRAIDRYGVTKRAEQYQGWKRLAAPGQEQKRGTDWALSHLAALAQTTPVAIRGNAAALDLAYRTAAKKTHPDAGGSAEAFQMLQEAMQILQQGARA